MTTKHTPGPWEKADGTDGITRGIRGWHGPEMVNVINWNGISRSTSVTGQANANLIAAAPDLLAALQDVDALWMHNSIAHGDGKIGPLHEKVIAAIAKATGEHQ